MSVLRIEVAGLDKLIREVDRLQRAPSAKTTATLDAALASAFARTQADVHVHTGELKATGRHSSEVDRHHWEGTIVYDGWAAEMECIGAGTMTSTEGCPTSMTPSQMPWPESSSDRRRARRASARLPAVTAELDSAPDMGPFVFHSLHAKPQDGKSALVVSQQGSATSSSRYHSTRGMASREASASFRCSVAQASTSWPKNRRCPPNR